jgi:maltose-binding protein MalE
MDAGIRRGVLVQVTGGKAMKPSRQARELVDEFLRGRLDRRELLWRAAALGATASVLTAVGRSGLRSAAAQEAAQPGGNEPQGPQVERLVFWTRASPDDPSSDEAPSLYTQLQAVATAYQEKIGTTVELVTVPNDDFRSRMSLAAPGGEGPDVFGPVAHDWIGEFAIQQIALAIPETAIDGRDDFNPVGLDLSTVDGTLYGLPIFLESVALIYNTDMVPTPPATWEELVATATSLTEGDVYGFGFPLLEQYHEGGFFHGFGGYIFGGEAGALNIEDIGLNNAGSVEAAKFLRDMYHLQQPPLPEVAIDRANMHAAQEGMQESGLIAMTINGPWREGGLRRGGINFAVAKLPTLPTGEPMRPFAGVQSVLANAYGEQQDAALDFLRFATGTDSQVLLYRADPKVVARTSALQSPTVAESPTIAAWAEQLNDAVPMPNIPAMGRVWTPWGAAMDAIIPPNASDEEVQALLDGAVEQIREAIEEFQ